MAVNQHHIEERRGFAIIPPGESLLMRCENVELSFSNMSQLSPLFKNPKKGKVYLTPYRVIFVASYPTKDSVMSFMIPFNRMRDCTVEQPTFGANYLKGVVSAAPDGGWEGEATFRLTFRSGGAIEFGRLMMACASNAAKGLPPPVTLFGFSPEATIFFTANLPRVPLGATQLIYVMPNNCPYMPTPPASAGLPPWGSGAPFSMTHPLILLSQWACPRLGYLAPVSRWMMSMAGPRGLGRSLPQASPMLSAM
ncbi:postacrosomal sheath WW domain-binding protein isoform X2 [Phascolarctos cinereus]